MIRIGNTIINQHNHPDNSLKLKLPEKLGNSLIVWHYESDAELFTLICIKKHYQHKKLNLYMPYMPHARMDRVQNQTDVFTLKYFCDIINSLDFNIVYIEDPHSNVCEALLNNVQVITAQARIETTLEKISDRDIIMCYPDESAMKRYSRMIPMPYTFGVKQRQWENGVIDGLKLINEENVKDKNVLIVDDICSRGDTFVYAAKALKAAGAKKIYLYVTHCETTVFNGELFSSGLIEQMYTTNSIFPMTAENDMIEII